MSLVASCGTVFDRNSSLMAFLSTPLLHPSEQLGVDVNDRRDSQEQALRKIEETRHRRRRVDTVTN